MTDRAGTGPAHRPAPGAAQQPRAAAARAAGRTAADRHGYADPDGDCGAYRVFPPPPSGGADDSQRRWSDGGGKVISGLELLLYQGIDQINIVHPLGREIIDDQLRAALNNASK